MNTRQRRNNSPKERASVLKGGKGDNNLLQRLTWPPLLDNIGNMIRIHLHCVRRKSFNNIFLRMPAFVGLRV